MQVQTLGHLLEGIGTVQECVSTCGQVVSGVLRTLSQVSVSVNTVQHTGVLSWVLVLHLRLTATHTESPSLSPFLACNKYLHTVSPSVLHLCDTVLLISFDR